MHPLDRLTLPYLHDGIFTEEYLTMKRRRILIALTVIVLTIVACIYLAARSCPFLDVQADTATLVETAFPAKRGEGLMRDHPELVVPIALAPDGGFATAIPESLDDGKDNLAHLPAAEQIRRRRVRTPVVPLRPNYPARFDGVQVVRSGRQTVSLRPQGAASVPGTIAADGSLVYRDAFPGTDVLHRAAPAKNEEFLVVRERPEAGRRWTWDMDTGGLIPHRTRLNVIELRNADGVALLRIPAPLGRDASGRALACGRGLEIACEPVEGNTGRHRFSLSLEEPQKWEYPVVIDPSVSSCGSMNDLEGFGACNAASLKDHRVVGFGGIYSDMDKGYTSPDATWMFDPGHRVWTDIGVSHGKYYTGRAITLDDGRVVTSGSRGHSWSLGAGSQMFDPDKLSWTILSNGPSGYEDGKAMAKLTDGRVMLGGFYSEAWLFDPTTDQWTKTADLNQSRRGGQCVASLSDGKAIVCSGYHSFGPRLTCEIWDPVRNTWQMGPSLPDQIHEQTALGLPDGRAVISNGSNIYLLSSTYDQWTTITASGFFSSGDAWDPNINLAIHPTGIVIGQGGTFDPSRNVFRSYYSDFGNSSRSPFPISEDEYLWMGSDGRGNIVNLAPVCADYEFDVHWNGSVTMNLDADSAGGIESWHVDPPLTGTLVGSAPGLTYYPAPVVGDVVMSYGVEDHHFGSSNTGNITIHVTNASPVINNQSWQIIHDRPLQGQLVGSDPDQDPVVYSVVSNGSKGDFSFTDVANGYFRYEPRSGMVGVDTVSVAITDGAGAQAVATLSIHITNASPTVLSSSAITLHDTTVMGTLTATDGDGDQLTYRVVTQGNLGNLSLPDVHAAGFRYVPRTQVTGIDQITVSVTDTAGAVATAVITVSITNQVPSASDLAFSMLRNERYSGTLVGTDADGEGVTYAVVADGSLGAFTFIDQSGAFTYIPRADVFGHDDVTVLVTDGAGASAIAHVSIDIIATNQPPVLVAGPDVTVPETATARIYPGWVASVSCGPAYESTQQVAEYRVSVDQSQWFLEAPAIAADGTLRFTPAGNLNLPTTVTMTIQVRDDGGTDHGGIDLSTPITALIHLQPVADTLTVTTTADDGVGSLRDCLSRAHGGDTVTFAPTVFHAVYSSAETVINVLSPLPALDDGGITIDATEYRVTLNGSGAGSADGLVVTSAGNRIFGLNLVGFTRSGVLLIGTASGNQLGGSRAVGAGPNGQGLRIANNGSFGIRMSGPGVHDNAVVGCWLGLAANGTSAEPNLAGVLIEAGAAGNTIGSINAALGNRIGGNIQEGIAITGSGSDGTIVIGNGIGGGRDGRGRTWAVGNGASGVYISQGTTGTRVGTATDDEPGAANDIAGNGGWGIEVRNGNTRRHAFRGNRITGNALGGIGLFDGANGQVPPPVIAAAPLGAGTVSGSAPLSDGTVEVFNDPGDQGATWLGSALVVNGVWSTSVVRDPALSLTATFTDAEGNTSPFTMLDGAHPRSSTSDDDEGGGGGCGMGSGIALVGLFSVLFLGQLRLRRRGYTATCASSVHASVRAGRG